MIVTDAENEHMIVSAGTPDFYKRKSLVHVKWFAMTGSRTMHAAN